MSKLRFPSEKGNKMTTIYNYSRSNEYSFTNNKQSIKQKNSSLNAERKYGYFYKEFFEIIRETKALRKPRKK